MRNTASSLTGGGRGDRMGSFSGDCVGSVCGDRMGRFCGDRMGSVSSDRVGCLICYTETRSTSLAYILRHITTH